MAIGTAFLGGALIGLGAAVLWLTHGRIAGASGLLDGALSRVAGAGTARLFVAGLLSTGIALRFAWPERFDLHGPLASLPLLIPAGVCVGFGTRLGGGCTSGHGVCGIARGSKRSLVATLTFMLSAAITVYVMRHGS